MSDRTVTRVRHELQFRLLQVQEVACVTPHLVRVTLGGEQLRGFASPSFDDHVKVFFPPAGAAFDTLPSLSPNGPVFGAGVAQPVAARDYTPHHFDPAALTLQLDFSLHKAALHGAGPATTWARRARKGDTLIVGGPRGSFVVGAGFDWHLLMGDDTALPAIRRRLAELPERAHAVVLAEVDGPEDEEPFTSTAAVDVRWVHRTRGGDREPVCLADALMLETLPSGDYYAWAACESADAKVLRTALLARGANRAALKVSGYWHRGAAPARDVHDSDSR